MFLYSLNKTLPYSINSVFLYIDFMQTDSRVNTLLQTFFVGGKWIFIHCSKASRCAIVQSTYTCYTGSSAWTSTWPIQGLSRTKLRSEVCTGQSSDCPDPHIVRKICTVLVLVQITISYRALEEWMSFCPLAERPSGEDLVQEAGQR